MAAARLTWPRPAVAVQCPAQLTAHCPGCGPWAACHGHGRGLDCGRGDGHGHGDGAFAFKTDVPAVTDYFLEAVAACNGGGAGTRAAGTGALDHSTGHWPHASTHSGAAAPQPAPVELAALAALTDTERDVATELKGDSIGAFVYAVHHGRYAEQRSWHRGEAG